MTRAKLELARVRPARSDEDLERAAEFLKTPRVHELVSAHPDERGCVRLCESGDEILGAILLDPSPLRIRDVDVPCARIQETPGEDGRIQYRRTGDESLFEFLIEEFLGYLWARRYPLAYAHGELALYPNHGFVPCFFHPRVYVDVKRALTLPSRHRVRHLKSDDVQHVLRLREAHRPWKPVVFAAGVSLFKHFCIEGEQRRIVGYFSLENDRGAFFAPEVDVADRAAACTLLHHCAEKADELGLGEMHFPLGPGHPVARLCLELGGRSVVRAAASDPLLDEEMICVVDTMRLIGALGPHFDRLGLDDVDWSLPIVTDRGAWTLRARDGAVYALTLDEPADDAIEMPYWVLTQLLVGYRGADEIDASMTRDQREQLDRLFPREWPYSMSDADHWEDPRPPVPYTEAGLAAVEKVRLPWAQ